MAVTAAAVLRRPSLRSPTRNWISAMQYDSATPVTVADTINDVGRGQLILGGEQKLDSDKFSRSFRRFFGQPQY